MMARKDEKWREQLQNNLQEIQTKISIQSETNAEFNLQSRSMQVNSNHKDVMSSQRV